ncbi:MAG TPA: sialidase family protein [Acidimicrobiales bacterium]|nr:sialidase family protein [Acidimicrobiales bacterium]
MAAGHRRQGAARAWAVIGVGLGLLVATPSIGLAQSDDEPVVTPSVQVTDDPNPTRAHNQPQVLVHPKDKDILAVVEAEFLSSTCHVHISRDGGRTWAESANRPMPPQYRACARPAFGPYLAAAFGGDGTLYVVGAGSETGGNQGPTDAFVARSTDLGETWEFSVIAESQEVEYVTRDGETITEGERYSYTRMAVHPTDPNLVYAGFRVQPAQAPFAQVPVRTVVAVSTDGGRTWSEPVDVMDETFSREEVYGSDVPSMAVSTDGTIYAFTKERPPPAPPPPTPSPPTPPLPPPPGPAPLCRPAGAATTTTEAPAEAEESEESASPPVTEGEPGATTTTTEAPETTTTTTQPPPAGEPGAGSRLLMSKSTDGGHTWQASVVDDSGLVCVPCLTTPEATIDPETGDLYLVFEQSDSGPPNARDNRNIWFMRSSDGGETWSERTRLNDDDDEARDPGYDQLFPGIDVAPDGRIDVAWYDFRTDAVYNPVGTGKTDRSEETCWDVFFTSSTDSGASWSRNVRVSDRTMNQNEGYVLHLSYDLRGPIGVASTDEVTYVGWSDSRSGRVDLPTEDVYVASVLHEPAKGDAPTVQPVSMAMGAGLGLVVAGLAALAGVAVLGRRARGDADTA